MPTSLLHEGLGRGRTCWTLAAVVLLFGCSKESPKAHGTPPSARPTPAASAPPDGKFRCQGLISEEPGVARPLRTVRLRPPDRSAKTIVLSKTGVVVTFNRDDFLATAHCLGLEKAAAYVEREMQAHESPLRDAFQLSYVAAALLDAGRVGVRLEDEKGSRATIVRDSWSEEGCAGQCRAFGREYRLSESDPFFFFRVTDKREDKAK